MQWINFLHFYQPANIDAFVIKEATERSYLRILRALEKNKNIKFTANITGCLILRWEELGYNNILKIIKKLVKRGQLELAGTAAYHPILPLIPKEEAKIQIRENEKIIKKSFGNIKMRGFFMPEMAYSAEAAKLIKALGYEYLILEEISYNGKLNQVNFNNVYRDKNSGLKIIFRSRTFSHSYVPEKIGKIIEKKGGGKKIIITATDAELYGLRHIDPNGKFEKLLKNKKIKTLTISEFIKNKKAVPVFPVAANWESTEEEIKNKQPYSLWFNKKNEIQKKLWQLAHLAYAATEKFKNDGNFHWARWHLVRGLASCTFWWASEKDFRHIFGPISWGPDMIERGANELIRSIRSLDNPKTRPIKIKAEKLFTKIRQMIWEKHWKKHWKK